MNDLVPLLALAAPLAFVVAGAVAARHPGRRPVAAIRATTLASWLALAVAAVAGAAVAAAGSTSSALVGAAGLGLSVRLDGLSTVMLAMIALLAVVIVRYSATYLDGDDRHGTFLGRLALTIAAVQVLVLSGNLAVLVLAWIATSLTLHQLLTFYPQRRGAVVAARKKFIVARIGDAFLVAAAALLHERFGTGELDVLLAGAGSQLADGFALGSLELAAACIAVAAILKSAQFPTHGWLVEVMETPTPVSALLHAGILNAGPFLVLRLAGVLDGADVANALLIVAGGATALIASVALLPQPSIKVVLGYSSAAHMGFMLMVCAIGVYPAAFLHLVAHSFYKAHAFLSSGSVVDEARAAGVSVPRRLGRPARVAASLGAAGALYAGFALLWGVDLVRDVELLAIGAILVLGLAQLLAPALDSDGPVLGGLRAGAMALGVTVAFFALEAGAHHLLKGTVPEITGREVAHLVLLGGVLVAFAGVIVLQILEPARPATGFRRRLAVHFRNGLYANALFDRAVRALRTPAPTGR